MMPKLRGSPERALFAGMLAYFSPLLSPATRAAWCHHGGRVATEHESAQITIFFGVHDRVDHLAHRLYDIGVELIDHAWISASIEANRKLDVRGYKFCELKFAAGPTSMGFDLSPRQERLVSDSGLIARPECYGATANAAKYAGDSRMAPQSSHPRSSIRSLGQRLDTDVMAPSSSTLYAHDPRDSSPGAEERGSHSFDSTEQGDSRFHHASCLNAHLPIVPIPSSGSPALVYPLMADDDDDDATRDGQLIQAIRGSQPLSNQSQDRYKSEDKDEDLVIKREDEEEPTSDTLLALTSPSCRLSFAQTDCEVATTTTVPSPSQPDCDSLDLYSSSRLPTTPRSVNVWSELFTSHPPSASSGVAAIPASEFLNAFSFIVDDDEMDPSNLRQGLNLIEHGVDGFRATKKRKTGQSTSTKA